MKKTIVLLSGMMVFLGFLVYIAENDGWRELPIAEQFEFLWEGTAFAEGREESRPVEGYAVEEAVSAGRTGRFLCLSAADGK